MVTPLSPLPALTERVTDCNMRVNVKSMLRVNYAGEIAANAIYDAQIKYQD